MMGLACSWDRETKHAYGILVGKSLGKCIFRDRRRYKDNINTDLWETGYEGGTWLELAHDCARRYHSIKLWDAKRRKRLLKMV